MTKYSNPLTSLEAQGLVEYGFILLLVTLVVVSTLAAIGPALVPWFRTAVDGLAIS